MRKLLALSLFFCIYSYSETIKESGLDKNAKINLDRYLIDAESKVLNIRERLKNEKVNTNNLGSSEIFLEELEDENSGDLEIGLQDINVYNNRYNNNSSRFSVNKSNNLGNVILKAGVDLGYDNLLYKKEISHGFAVGLNLAVGAPDYNIDFITKNEFIYSMENDYNQYNTSSVIGGAKFEYTQHLYADNLYISPALLFIYKVNIDSLYKFNNTDVKGKKSFNYGFGALVKFGYKKEVNDNKYNVYVDLGMDKRMLKKETFLFKFKDKVRDTEIKVLNDLVFDINGGFDVVINKSHKLSFGGGVNFYNVKDLSYKGSIGYTFIKK